MTILQRYFLRDFIKLFVVLTLGLSVSVSLLDLLSSLGGFIAFDPPASGLLQYAALKFPGFLLYVIPMSALLCSIFVVSHAVRTRETVAAMAAGGRLRLIFAPFLIAGLIISVGSFALGEFGIPKSARAARLLKDKLKHRKTMPSLFKDGSMWIRANDGSLVRIDLYIENRDRFEGLSIYRIEGDRIAEIIDAREAAYLPDAAKWQLQGVKRLDTASGLITTEASATFGSLGSPQVLREDSQDSTELGIVDLYAYLGRLKQAGFKNQRLSVDLHGKLAYPLISFIMVMLGVSFAAARQLKGMVAAAFGIMISLLYFFGYSMMVSLGYAAIIPPAIAAWTVPIMFALVGIRFYTKIPE